MNFINHLAHENPRITFLKLLVTGLIMLSCQSEQKESPGGDQHQSTLSNYQVLSRSKPTDPYYKVRKGHLVTPSGRMIKTTLAITPQEQQKGLSGTRPQDMGENEGLLFFYLEDGPRRFWMIDTYIDLDIIFLDKNFEILAIERDMPAHPGKKEPPPIARTKTYTARHVLEIKSKSALAKSLKKGMRLKWVSKLPIQKIESNIRSSR